MARSAPVHGQELSLLSGATQSQADATYSWQLEFYQPLHRRLAVSLSWLNEGHFPEHHRDGVMGQAWLQMPRSRAWRFAVGAGPYVYFDTEPSDDRRGYGDHHGIGAALSGAIWWQVARAWSVQLRLNAILAQGDIDTRSIMLGATYQLTSLRLRSAFAHQSDGALPPDERQQLTVFAGRSTLNSLGSREWTTYGADYQYAFNSWFGAGALAIIDPGSRASQDSVGMQLRLFHRLDGSPLTLTIGIGGDIKVTAPGWHHADPVEGLLLMRAGWNLTRRLSLEASWYRSFTHDDHDLDIITGGLGWRFGTR